MAEAMTWEGWRGAVGWSGAVALNLVIPLPLGLGVTSGDGQIGVVVGVLVCWAAGLFVCARSAGLGPVLIRGGGWVGLLQFIPFFHVMAGSFGLWFCEVVSITSGGSVIRTVLGGLAATLATALPLLLTAFVFGGGFRLFRAVPATEQATDYGEASPRPAEEERIRDVATGDGSG